MYDRTLLIATAQDKGHENPRQMAAEIGIDISAAYRLWNGEHAPAAATIAAVEEHYGLTARQLIKPAPAAV